MKHFLFLLITSGLLIFGTANVAHAGVIENTKFIYWNGICLDCSNELNVFVSPATAVFEVLEIGNGSTGTDLGLGGHGIPNLVGFTYTSPKYPSGITATTIFGASGVIPVEPDAHADVFISFQDPSNFEYDISFASSLSGNWCIGVCFDAGDVGADYGLNGAYNQSSVPEPGTLALFALGLAGLGIIRRKRYQHV